MESKVGIKEFLEFVAKRLVEKPDEVFVKEIEGASVTILELKVAKEDFGRILGKKGRIANAIRVLLKAVSGKEGRRTTLEIFE
jgi:uncharacterized protein